jgi:hypothetical protein
LKFKQGDQAASSASLEQKLSILQADLVDLFKSMSEFNARFTALEKRMKEKEVPVKEKDPPPYDERQRAALVSVAPTSVIYV